MVEVCAVAATPRRAARPSMRPRFRTAPAAAESVGRVRTLQGDEGPARPCLGWLWFSLSIAAGVSSGYTRRAASNRVAAREAASVL